MVMALPVDPTGVKHSGSQISLHSDFWNCTASRELKILLISTLACAYLFFDFFDIQIALETYILHSVEKSQPNNRLW